MTGNELRKSFVEFFEKKQHKYYESASLIPDDKTLLLTVAGMVPFKPFFLGEKKAPYKRITTYQKCIRTNDLENVGITPRHHTFFEMLGNFSFGDYFKKEAITWSWEYITEVLKLDKERLWVSVHFNDDEAYNIWLNDVKVPSSRIVRLGDEDNWWSAGEIGSCGPCTEIYYDTQNMGKNNEEINSQPGDEGDRFLEIWNLVFTEWNKKEDGTLVPLPNKNIDTGAGLERVLSVVQNKKNNFETDLFIPIINKIKEIINNKSEDKILYNIIADHIRASTFLICDGVIPSNEGRGYILKKIIRRAYGSGAILDKNILEKEEIFLYKIVPTVIKIMKEAYPELIDKQEYIMKVIKKEEEKFSKTLTKGMELLNNEVNRLNNENKKELDSEITFKLYDTYGFPFEFTKLIAEQHKLKLDEKEFNKKLEEQKLRSQNSREKINDMVKDEFIEKFLLNNDETIFEGYENDSIKAKVLYIQKVKKDLYEIIFDRTVFYAEAGGQVSDKGKIYIEHLFEANIKDVSKKNGVYIHYINNIKGSLPKINDMVVLEIDKQYRIDVGRNHTATHILHQAIKDILGDSANQSGSYVDNKRLRFDFTYYEAISDEKLLAIEKRVNEIILSNLEIVVYENMLLEDAIKKGAKALFHNKYGKYVRGVDIKGYTMELCGGTHLHRTSEVGLFSIISEQGKASGIRRIEAITGVESIIYLNKLESTIRNITNKFKTTPETFEKFINKYITDNKQMIKEINTLKSEISVLNSSKIEKEIIKKDNIYFLFKSFKNKSIDELKNIIDIIKIKYDKIVILLGSNNNNAIFISYVSQNLIQKYNASEIVKKASILADGNGGGKPTFAQAGGKKGNKVNEIINLIKEEIYE